MIEVVQMSDLHLYADAGQRLAGVDTRQSFLDVLGYLKKIFPNPDVLLATGDLVHDETMSGYEWLAGHLAEMTCPVYAIPGNHDDPSRLVEAFERHSLGCMISPKLGPWQLILLDSSVRGEDAGFMDGEQLAVLDRVLKETTCAHALVVLHHHPVLSGSAWLDTMTVKNSEAMFAVLEKYPQVRGVLFGHIHQELDRTERGLRFLGCPSTCIQFRPLQDAFGLDEAPPGFRHVILHDDGRIESSVHRLDGPPDGLVVNTQGY